MSEDDSRPPSPVSRPDTPSLIPGLGMGYFSAPFERFLRDETSDWPSAFTLLDTVETYFDSRLDLLERRLKKHSERLKLKAESFKIRKPASGGDILKTKDIDRELQKFKLKVSSQITNLAAAWQSAKVVRTREKINFFLGVMSLFMTALLFGTAPQWIPFAYTLQASFLLPIRWYTYKKRAWHYFLFDLCYYTTILNFIFIWFAPWSSGLWIACYCLSHGSLASAVITWRNSLVFHDFDKVTSLFIHIYPPLVLTVIRHHYPNAEARFPALIETRTLYPLRAFALSSLIYIIWQALYWKFVLINRRKKIESGERTTSFSWLLNDKKGVIGRMIEGTRPERREPYFMAGQMVYAIITEIPAVFLLYRSRLWSDAFLMLIFGVSVWNGGGFYIEVFGRKFERELEALRKELADVTSRSVAATPSVQTSPSLLPRSTSDDDLSVSTAFESPGSVARELSATHTDPATLALTSEQGAVSKKEQ